MQVPDSIRHLPALQRLKAKERIARAAERQRQAMGGFRFAPGRHPVTLVAVVFAMLMVGGMLVSSINKPERHGTTRASPTLRTFDELTALRIAVERFRRDCGRYPHNREGLLALVRDPGLPGWRGPYVNLVKPDAWRTHYRYQRTGDTVTIFSSGPDGKAGNADDIRAPDPEPDEVDADLHEPAPDPSEPETTPRDEPGILPPVRIGI